MNIKQNQNDKITKKYVHVYVMYIYMYISLIYTFPPNKKTLTSTHDKKNVLYWPNMNGRFSEKKIPKNPKQLKSTAHLGSHLL